MFCKKCGKELQDGEPFCPFCGTQQKAQAPKQTVPQSFGEHKMEGGMKSGNASVKKKETTFGKKTLIIAAAVLAAAVGAGCILYFNSAGYQCGKDIRLAEEALKKGEYQEAIVYCSEALERDEAYREAYLQMAEIYEEMDSYSNAIDILNKGIQKTKGDDAAQDMLKEELEDIYKAQARSLVGTWELRNYNILELFLGEGADYIDTKIEVNLLWEFSDDMTYRMYIDGQSLAKLTSGAVGDVVSLFAGKMVSSLAENAAGYLTKLLSGNAISNMAYMTEGEVLYMRDDESDDDWEGYTYRIDGDRLIYGGLEMIRVQ